MSPTRDAPRFGQVITAMVTPFDDNGALDLEAAADLARWLAAHGSDGLVLSGSTGESSVLTDDEKTDLWRAVADAVTIPVIAGTGSNDTPHTIEMTRRAAECGVDGILLVTPYYNRPSQAGIAEHFRLAAEAANGLPTLLYDIPVRAGRRIAPATMLKLAREVTNIVGVKDAANDSAGTMHLAPQVPEGFEIYSGDDVKTLPLLAVGAVGVISVAAHWVGPQFKQVVQDFMAGRLEAAIAGNAELLDSFDFESSEEFPNPLPAKAILRAIGLKVGQCRLPMGPSTPELDAYAAKVLAAVGHPAETA
ncbi:MAG TPA: 4-hydroxy-tetrahydrodipicolinate synthase [Acidimicrobiales bacterium]|jgi:4-hydroxy-tetrahydrodipicolinate synthase